MLSERPKDFFGNPRVGGSLTWQAIALDFDGTVIVAGWRGGFLDLGNGIVTDAIQLDRSGSGVGDKAVVAKFSKLGLPLWLQTAIPVDGATSFRRIGYGETTKNSMPVDWSELNRVAVDRDGNIFVLGFFLGIGTLALDNGADRVTGLASVKVVQGGYGRVPNAQNTRHYANALIAKLNPQGKVQRLHQPQPFPNFSKGPIDATEPEHVVFTGWHGFGPTLGLSGLGETLEIKSEADNSSSGNFTYIVHEPLLAPDGTIVGLATLGSKKEIELSPGMRLKGSGPERT